MRSRSRSVLDGISHEVAFFYWYSVREIGFKIDPSWRNNYESQIVGGSYCIECCDRK